MCIISIVNLLHLFLKILKPDISKKLKILLILTRIPVPEIAKHAFEPAL